jgi:hypothetical protein
LTSPGNFDASYDAEIRKLIGADLLIIDDFEPGCRSWHEQGRLLTLGCE